MVIGCLKTSLLTLAGVISRLDLLLTNDSGPAHIAFALGTPAVVIASSLEPDRYCPTESGPFAIVRPLPETPAGAACPPGCLHLETVAAATVAGAGEDLLQCSLPDTLTAAGSRR